jgi:adenosylcobyric acid synthase
VIPWVEGLSLDAEDSLALGRSTAAWGPAGTGAAGCPQPVAAPGGGIDVAVIRLPRIANFTDLDALAVEPAVAVRFVSSPAQLGSPDLILVPGSKTTVADLAWLRESGLASALAAAVEAPGGPVLLGVCAGYQMLGEWIDDVVESTAGRVPGLGMLAVQTRFEEDKVTLPRRGSALGTVVTGYEIRHGRPVVGDGSGWIALDRVPAEGAAPEGDGEELEGASGDGGRVLGTSLHGLFESDSFRSEFLRAVAARAGKAFWPSGVSFAGAREAQFERVADLVEQYLDVESLWQIIAGRSRAGVSP